MWQKSVLNQPRHVYGGVTVLQEQLLCVLRNDNLSDTRLVLAWFMVQMMGFLSSFHALDLTEDGLVLYLHRKPG